MKYSNAALTTVIGSEIPHHKPHRLCALCSREDVATTCVLVCTRSAKTPGQSLCVTESIIHHIVSYVALGKIQQLWEVHEKPLTQSFWPTVGKDSSPCMMCVHVYVCAGVQREQSRQANRQANRVLVRSGARWSVSGNDTWQQLGGCALAVLYIHVTTDKSQHLLSRRNYRSCATGSSIQDRERRMRTLPSFPVPPVLTEQTSRDSCDGHWLGKGEGANLVSARGRSKASPDLGLESETWMPLFWLCNSQGQREVHRSFSVTVNVAGRLQVSYWVKQNNQLQGLNLF